MDSPIFPVKPCGVCVPRTVGRVTRRDCLRAAVDLATEVAIVWSFLKGYNIIRDCFGSSAVMPAVAAAHARQVGHCQRRGYHAIRQRRP